MSKIKITKLKISGDKSISHRALIIGSLAEGETRIINFLDSADCKSTLNILRELGVNIETKKGGTGFIEEVKVQGVGLNGFKIPNNYLNAGNSGTTMRLLSGILAGQNFPSTITGDQSLSKRPMDRVIKPLREMGAEITGTEDKYPPINIKGRRLKFINYNMPIASAQVKSCLLFAGLYADRITSVSEPIKSRDHTERMLQYMGAGIKVDGLKVTVEPGKILTGKEIKVPGDISSAAFFIVAAIITGISVLIKDVGVNKTRTGIVDVLKKMGAGIEYENNREWNNEPVADIIVEGNKQLKGIEIEGDMIPEMIDEIPVLAVAAATAHGRTEISGAGELRVKESDRINAVCSELAKIGVKIMEKKDGFIIDGPSKITGTSVKSYGDHRIAMMLKIASLVADGEVMIDDKECISISFPEFMDSINIFTKSVSNSES